MKTQELKILPKHFNAIKDGYKTFEIREDDRNFEIEDLVILYEFIPSQGYTGKKLDIGYINYIFKGGESGLDEDYVIFSTDKMEFVE